jgi:hypothetical protein
MKTYGEKHVYDFDPSAICTKTLEYFTGSQNIIQQKNG